jgi:hypothetical protein
VYSHIHHKDGGPVGGGSEGPILWLGKPGGRMQQHVGDGLHAQVGEGGQGLGHVRLRSEALWQNTLTMTTAPAESPEDGGIIVASGVQHSSTFQALAGAAYVLECSG